MPLSKKKKYARFNVGEMMKAKRELRNDIAQNCISLQENRKNLESVGAKKRRLENKVAFIYGVS